MAFLLILARQCRYPMPEFRSQRMPIRRALLHTMHKDICTEDTKMCNRVLQRISNNHKSSKHQLARFRWYKYQQNPQ